MIGWNIFPEAARERHPGQVPKLTSGRGMFAPAIDPSRPAPKFTMQRFFDETRPILRVRAITDGLGLEKHFAKDIQRIVGNEVKGATGELTFRQGLLGQLRMKSMDSTVRRVVMNRALDFYKRNRRGRGAGPLTMHKAVTPVAERAARERGLSPAEAEEEAGKDPSDVKEELTRARKQGGDYHRRIPKESGGYRYVYDEKRYKKRKDAHLSGNETRKQYLKRAVCELIGDGCEVRHLQTLVKRYGPADVAEAISSNGSVCMDAGKLKYVGGAKKKKVKKSESPRLHMTFTLNERLEKAPAVGQAAPAGAGGAGGGSTGSPAGTRQVWRNRIVEKQPDGSWKTVGKVGGLEGERVPRKQPPGKLDVSKLTEAQAQALINQLKREKKG